MVDGMEAEQTIIEISRELARFKAASQQLEVTAESLDRLQDRLGKLAEFSNGLLAEVKASFETYTKNIEQQAAAVLGDIRGLDLAEFKAKMDADVDSLRQALGDAASTNASRHEDVRSYLDNRFASVEARHRLLLGIVGVGAFFAALSAILVVVMS
jgi:DNA anti-recombination protein RmuC